MTTLNRGNGSDGNITISSNKNLHTDVIASGRSYADMICYSVISVGTQDVTVSVGTINGIVAGDEVLLINIQGTPAGHDNVGNYETFTVDSVNGSVISFQAAKTKYYGEGSTNDTNIGTTSADQKVIIQRVPQYDNVTIDNGYTLSANAFDGAQYGVIFFRVQDTLTVNGAISMNSCGYRYGLGGAGGQHGYRGESLKVGTQGYGSNNYGGGSGGRYVSSSDIRAGAGGGYGTEGQSGMAAYGSSLSEAPGGSVYGDATMSGIYLGSGGGGGAHYSTSSRGGSAGGAICISAMTCSLSGYIYSNGGGGIPVSQGPLNSSGGGGSGGSIFLIVGTITMGSSTVSAVGGAGGDGDNWGNTGDGGDGGDGRIAIYYNTLTDNITTSPTAYTSSGVQLPYKFSGTLNEDAEVRIYNVNTGVLVRKENHSAGAYEIDNVPYTTVDVVAKAADGEIKGYGNVVPVSG